MGDLQLMRNAIKAGLERYAEIFNQNQPQGMETFTAFDEKNDHYFLHELGWDGDERIWNTPIYVRIRQNKAWIEVDWTEEGIATDLLAAGIPKQQIVLAFYPLEMRQHSEFAVA